MRLAIIGGGFSAAALLRQLLEQRVPVSALQVVEPRACLGEGVAYGDATEELLLNTRAGAMGLDAAQPGGFADWAQLPDGDRDAFLPRRRYADYLRQCVAQDLARAPFPVEWRRGRCAALVRDGDTYLVDCEGTSSAADAVVLAIGALPPSPLPGIAASLHASGRFVDHVWAEDWIPRVRPDDHVAILGTGLTMVDQVQRLRASGHRGTITALSRRGQLPQVHAAAAGPVASVAVQAAALSALPLRGLLHGLRASARNGLDWRSLLDALRPHHRAIWQRLTQAERRAFLRHLRPWWDTHRHRMAPSAGAWIQAEIAAGTLRVRAASLLSATGGDGHVELTIRPRQRSTPERMEADLLVRATGLDLSVTPRVPLLAALLDGGLLAPDPLGLGVQATEHCEAIGADGRPTPGLFVLGPLLAGRWWEATAVPDIRVDAQALASRLALWRGVPPAALA